MRDDNTTNPHFDNPPVIETVLGVQFAPLNGLTSAHLGWFWKKYLDEKWEKVADAVPLPDESEVFGPNLPVALQFRFAPLKLPARLQISQGNDGRMIQIQPTRFHYNWNRVGGEYPHYRSVRKEFDQQFATFCRFVADAKQFGEVVPNQWELTYIDSIPRGSLWNTPADWHEILPGLFPPLPPTFSVPLESFEGHWHFEIPRQRGRLHISVQLARFGSNPEPVLLFQTTARGPIGKDVATNLYEGLDLGHQTTVETFVRITSEKAHKVWNRKA